MKKIFRQNDARDFRLCEYLKKPRLDEQDGFIGKVSINHSVNVFTYALSTTHRKIFFPDKVIVC